LNTRNEARFFVIKLKDWYLCIRMYSYYNSDNSDTYCGAYM